MFWNRRAAVPAHVEVTALGDLGLAVLAYTSMTSAGDHSLARRQAQDITVFLAKMTFDDAFASQRSLRASLSTMGVAGERVCAFLGANTEGQLAKFWQRTQMTLVTRAAVLAYS